MIATLHRRVLDLCGALAGIGFALIALATAYDVFVRNVFGESVRGLVDIVEYALFVTTFLAAPWVLRLSGHVQVDFAVSALPPRARRGVGRLCDAIGLAISLVLLVYSTRVTIAAWQQGSMVLKAVVFPEWWVFVVMPFATLLLAIEFAIRLAGRETTRGTLEL
jgi:TRAP-type C4-dicarboxylate transport system permease small subunit